MIRRSSPAVILAAGVTLLWCSAARAQFIPTTGTAAYDTATNWTGSVINGQFTNALTGTLTATFAADRVQSTDAGLTFTYTGAFNTTLQSAGTAARLLTLNGNITVNSGPGGRTITLGSTTAANGLNVALGASRTITVSGTTTNDTLVLTNIVSGAGFSITKAGAGTLTLSGVNTFGSTTLAGQVNITAGQVNIAADSGLGAVPTSAVAGELILNGGILNSAATMTLNANRGIALGSATAASGGTLNSSSGTLTYNGIIANNGSTNLLTRSAGTVQLGGANTYSGGTALAGGTTIMANSAALGAAGTTWTSSASNTLQANADFTSLNYNVTLTGGTLTVSGSNSIGFTGGTLTVSGGNRTLASSIAAGKTLTLNTIAMAINGTSRTLTISGTGATTVTGAITDGSTATASSLTITNTGTTTLAGADTFGGTLTMNSAGGTLVISGTNTLRVTNSNTVAGSVAINNGIVVVNNANPFGNAPIFMGAGSAPTLRINGLAPTFFGLTTLGSTPVVENANATTAGTLTFNPVGGIVFNGILRDGTGSAALNVVKTGAGAQILGGTNTYTGTTTINAGLLQFNSAASVGGTGASVTIADTATGAAGYAIDNGFLGRIATGSAGVIGLAANSSSPLDMSAFTTARLGAASDSTYSGALTPNGNTFRLGGGGGTLTVSSVLADPAGGGSNGLDVGLNNTGAGTVSLTGANTFTGPVSINSGTLRIAGDGTTPGAASPLGAVPSVPTAISMSNGGLIQFGGPVTLHANRTLSIGGGGGGIDTNGNDVTFANTVTGTGAFIKAGAGTMTLPGAIGTDAAVAGGTLASAATTGTAITAGNISMAAGTTLSFKPALVSPTTDVAVSVANGSPTTGLTYTGGVIGLDPNGNQSLTVTLGDPTNVAALTRGIGGTLIIAPAGGTGVLGGTQKLIVAGGVPTFVGNSVNMVSPSILGRNTDGNVDFLTHNAAGFQVVTYSAADVSAPTTTANDVVNQTVSPAAPLAAQAAAYALKVGTGVTIDIGTQTLTLGNGTGQAGLILNAATIAGTGATAANSLTFGGAEGHVYLMPGTSTITAPITATNGLKLAGPGTLVLAPGAVTNVLNGNIVIGNGATLSITGPNGTTVPTALGATAQQIIMRGGTFQVTGGNYDPGSGTKSFVMDPAGGGTFDVASGFVFTTNDASQIGGSGSITKVGGGLHQIGSTGVGFGGASGFTGQYFLNQGTARILGPTSLGDQRNNTVGTGIFIGSGATLDLEAQVGKYIEVQGSGVGGQGAIINSGSIQNSGGPGTHTTDGGTAGQVVLVGDTTFGITFPLTGAGTADLAFKGPITERGGSRALTLTGQASTTGAFVMGGANTYSGGTTMTGGIATVAVSSVLSGSTIVSGPFGTGPVTLNPSTTTITVQDDAGIRTVANPVTTTGAVTLAGSGALTFSNTVGIGGTVTATTTGTLAFTNTVSGTGGITQTGVGVLVLSGANTFQGGVTMSAAAGIVQVGSNSVGPAGAVTSGPFGTGVVTPNNTTTPSIQAINGDHTVGNNFTLASGFTVSGTNSLTLSGTLSDSASGRTITSSITPGAGNKLLTMSGSLVINDGTVRTMTLAGTGNTLISGSIIDGTPTGGSLTVSNTGVTTMSGNNTYAGTLTDSGAASTVNVSGSNAFAAMAVSGTGSTVNMSGTVTSAAATTINGGSTVNVLADNAMGTTGTVTVGSGTTVGNLSLSANQTVAGLLAAANLSTGTSTITIAGGKTLAVNNQAATPATPFVDLGTIGGASGAAPVTNVTFTGAGSFTVDTPNSPFQVGQAGTISAVGNNNVVDMSGLSTFAVSHPAGPNPIGATEFRVGDASFGTNGFASSNLTLAKTSTIITNAIEVGVNIRNNTNPVNVAGFQTNTLKLGTVSNTINADFIYVGSNQAFTGDPLGIGGFVNGDQFQRDDGQITFATAAGTLLLRGTNGGSTQTNLAVGALNTPNGSPPTATLHVDKFDVSGHAADMAINQMVVGTQTNSWPVTGVYSLDASFAFDTGTLSVATLQGVGTRTGANTAITAILAGATVQGKVTFGNSAFSPTGTTGTVTIGSGVTVGSNSINMTGAFAVNGITIPMTGSFNVQNGAAVTVGGDMKIGENTGAITSTNLFNTSGQMNVSGGSLAVNGALTVGTASTGAADTGTVANIVSGSVAVSGGSMTTTGGITLATNTTTTGNRPNNVTGTVTVSGGSLTVGGDIVKGAAGGPGTAAATLSLTGGTLNLGGNRIGGTTAAASLDTLTLQAGTLMNVAEVNNGSPLVKSGAGTLTLSGTNTYTGATTIGAGTLALTGAAAVTNTPSITVGTAPGSSAVLDVTAVSGGFQVGSGKTLGGHGTVTGPVTFGNGGVVSPGTSPGTLTFSTAPTMQSGSTYLWELGTAGAPDATQTGQSTVNGGVHDVLNATSGTLDLTQATLNLVSLPATTFDNTQPYSWKIANAPTITGTPTLGTITGTDFSSLNGGTFNLSNPGGSALLLNFSPSPVPEPAFVMLVCGAGAGAASWWSRRRRSIRG